MSMSKTEQNIFLQIDNKTGNSYIVTVLRSKTLATLHQAKTTNLEKNLNTTTPFQPPVDAPFEVC